MKKHIRKLGLFTGLLTASMLNTIGQNSLYVTTHFGTTSQYNLEVIKSIKHTATEMIIWKTDGSSVNILLSDIKRYTYKPNPVMGMDHKKDEVPSFTIYPNPNTGKFNISYQLNIPDEVYFKLMTQDGKIVQSIVEQQIFAGTYHLEFDATSIQQGIYILHINTSQKNATHKLLINP